MSLDAIAILPRLDGLHGTLAEGEWRSDSEGRGLYRHLTDATLVHLSLAVGAPDADLHAAARVWLTDAPARIWVFADTAVPPVANGAALRRATRAAGRWVGSGKARRSLLEDVGFSAEEAAAWQRDVKSGDPTRLASARELLAKRVEGRDPAEVDALIEASLKRR